MADLSSTVACQSSTVADLSPTVADQSSVRGITFDFGNTLVPVSRPALDHVVAVTCAWLGRRAGAAPEGMAAMWAEERERQWREDVPAFRETDLRTRMVRLLARARGFVAPPPDVAWDDGAAADLTDPDEVGAALEVYARAFAELPPTAGASVLLERLARRGFVLGILSNWPLAAAIDHYADARGWTGHLAAIVVSERVGTIKPRVEMYQAAEAALGLPASSLLHVGDDWTADVAGALDAGWRAGWVRDRPADTPLPGGIPDAIHRPDLVLDRLVDLEGALGSFAR